MREAFVQFMIKNPEIITTEELKELALMWEGAATLFEFQPNMVKEAAIYRECANDLRKLLSGDKSMLEKW